MDLVSIVIPSYNSAIYLGAALESVLAQTYENWEVVLVDDGSTDGTRELVNAMLPRFEGRLRYVYQANRGLPVARNAAIRCARGKLIAFLDADDVWLPERLERGVARMDSDTSVGLVHAKVARIDEHDKIIEHPPSPAPRYLDGQIAAYLYDRRAHILCPTVLVRASCLDEVGLFDEAMRATEDRDLWYRIAVKYRVGYLPEVLAYYRISPGSMSRDFGRMLAAQKYFIQKHRHNGSANLLEARASLGNVFRERGDALLKAGAPFAAIRWYFKSVWQYPLSGGNVYMFFRSFAEPLVSLFQSGRKAELLRSGSEQSGGAKRP